MGMNDIMERLKNDETTKIAERAEFDGDKVTFTISRHQYNLITESLRSLEKNKKNMLNKLPSEDFKRKSYGRNLYDINCLINELREALGERLVDVK